MHDSLRIVSTKLFYFCRCLLLHGMNSDFVSMVNCKANAMMGMLCFVITKPLPHSADVPLLRHACLDGLISGLSGIIS